MINMRMNEEEDRPVVPSNNMDDTTASVAPNFARKLDEELEKFPQTHSAEFKRWSKLSIHRIPQSLKEQNGSGPYKPQKVSIGPYHHGEPQLASMEEHKRRALLTFLYRSGKPVNCYIAALAPVVEDLMDAYQQLDPKWKLDTEAFLELMVVDGCFLLEILRTAITGNSREEMGYALNDPVFSNHGNFCLVPYLKGDMLLLENQLPFLLLYTLFFTAEAAATPISQVSFMKRRLVAKFFSLPYNTNHIREYEECLHILDMYRRIMLSNAPNRDVTFKENRWSGRNIYKDSGMIRSATELKVAGIRFEGSGSQGVNNVVFASGAVLKLPMILVGDSSKSLFLNIMAFQVGMGNEVAAYAFLMDDERDVRLLQSCGIIQNALGSDRDVAALFNSISKDVFLDLNSNLGRVFDAMDRYCGRTLPRFRTLCKRIYDYFTNPWVGLSVVAALVLFALNNVQAVYSVLAYYQSKP